MSIDIVLFALVAAFIVHRLRSVLGTRNGNEKQRPNPFSSTPKDEEKNNVLELNAQSSEVTIDPQELADIVKEKISELNIKQVIDDGLIKKDEELESALIEIKQEYPEFDLHNFADGAKMAFEIILEAFAEGNMETLEPLLSQKLYEDFKKDILNREDKGLTIDMELHEIKSMQIIDACLAGTMVYITVDFDVEETLVTKKADGSIIKSKSKEHKEMHDIWTFAHDIRNVDPTWMLIETRV